MPTGDNASPNKKNGILDLASEQLDAKEKARKQFDTLRGSMEELVNKAREADALAATMAEESPAIFKARLEILRSRSECLFALVATAEEWDTYKAAVLKANKSVDGVSPKISEVPLSARYPCDPAVFDTFYPLKNAEMAMATVADGSTTVAEVKTCTEQWSESLIPFRHFQQLVASAIIAFTRAKQTYEKDIDSRERKTKAKAQAQGKAAAKAAAAKLAVKRGEAEDSEERSKCAIFDVDLSKHNELADKDPKLMVQALEHGLRANLLGCCGEGARQTEHVGLQGQLHKD